MRNHEECKWGEGCEEPLFEDWYYCEEHARKVGMMNTFFWGAFR